MADELGEKIVTKQSCNQKDRQYVYSEAPNVPKLHLLIRKGDEKGELWNALIDMTLLPDKDLSVTQRMFSLIMAYDGEIHNGGHGQYFANKGTARLEELLNALQKVGADRQHDILKAASETSMPKRAKGIRGILGFVSYARQNEKYNYDQEYYQCKPSAAELAVQFAEANLDEFVKLV